MSLRSAGALLVLCCSIANAAPKRIVLIKIDGLSDDVIERNLDHKGSDVSRIPWIENIFVKQGTRVRNFYVRGLSLSVPSWSLLDTGRHLQIHGNAEFDRLTPKTYDYLNPFPFYVNYALSRKVDMPGVEVLDDCGVPLLMDSFAGTERFQNLQMFQRGVRWRTFQHGVENRFTSRTARDLLDEWVTGFQVSSAVLEQLERETIQKIADPAMRYIDYFSGEFDHIAHLTNDPAVQDRTLQHIDSFVGRVWAAIQRSPLKDETVLVLVSDHGINSTPGTYSQGYSLLDLFRSAQGGGHHVITNRYPLSEYKIRGLDPFVSKVTTESEESYYLSGEADSYPTALLDLDGNERASVTLRNSTLNVVQLLLGQLQRTDLEGVVRNAAASEVLRIIGENRAEWQRQIAELDVKIEWLQEHLNGFNAKEELKRQPKWTDEQRSSGMDQAFRRRVSDRSRLVDYQSGYMVYRRTLSNLLAIDEQRLMKGKFKTADLVPPRAMGQQNSVHDLANYVVGLSSKGLKLTTDGRIDQASFRTIDYFTLLSGVRVRNNVQKGVAAAPVDFIALRIDPSAITEPGVTGAVWLYSDETHQALVLCRGGDLKYLSIRSLRQDASRAIHFDKAAWGPGFPLRMFEDPSLEVAGDRTEWLNGWHSEKDWLTAVHRTMYSNGVIGVTEAVPPISRVDASDFHGFTRAMVRPDFLVFANDHWNFNVRGFNPGGNHGSFLRISTHSTLMFAGGGVPQGVEIKTPYDSLSFVPTVLGLLKREPKGGGLPGRPIWEVISR